MPTDTPLVHVDRRDDGVALVTLDNPKVNALSRELLHQLEAAADEVLSAPEIARVIDGALAGSLP